MMITFGLLGLLITSSYSLESDNKTCNNVLVNGVTHEKEIIKEIDKSPYQLAIDYDTNNLFFSFTDTNDDETLKSAYLNLNNNNINIINGIDGGFANTVDNDTHTVYLGGSDGIYTFDIKTNTATNLNITEKSIWQLYYSNGALYYTTYPKKRLHKYEKGVVISVAKLKHTKVSVAAIDNNKNIYFSNASGLFVYKKETETIMSLGKNEANSFTADINGKIYFADYEGIYKIDQDIVKNLVNISGLYGMAIERNGNIIYATGNSIVRLKPSNSKC